MSHLKRVVSGLAALSLVTAGTAFAENHQEHKSQKSQKSQPTQQSQRGQQQQQQQQMTGTIASFSDDTLYLATEQGAIAPFEVEDETKFEGKRYDGSQLSSADQLKAGDKVQVSFTASDDENSATSVKLQQDLQELSGKVAAIDDDDDTLYIEHEGAFIPLKVSDKTNFKGTSQDGQPIQKADQIRQGDEVRAGFQISNQKDNLAQTLEVQSSGQKSGGARK